MMAGKYAIIVIGRNEGDRLVACFRSLPNDVKALVYVDSGSIDNSILEARAFGAEVVELDLTRPFTAARARNAGARRLEELFPETAFIQFVDGDCEIVERWCALAQAALDADPDLGVVTGWNVEKHPEATVYNQMCDVEWRQPAGEIRVCGGIMMVRQQAFKAVGGFNEGIIAAEDDDFCLRIGAAGWRLRRLPARMTRHDAAMTRFSEWWRRAVRAGHGFAQVGSIHPGHFRAERRRAWAYGAIFPAVALLGCLAQPAVPIAIASVYGLSFLKTAHGLTTRGWSLRVSAITAAFLTIAKFPNFQGLATYWLRQSRGRAVRLIEWR